MIVSARDDREGTISTEEFAQLLNISPRNAIRALVRCAHGKTYRGAALTVFTDSGRGGAGGTRYRVAVASISPALISDAATYQRRTSGVGIWRYDLVLPIIRQTAPRSQERALMIKELAASAVYPNGKKEGRLIGERTLQAWIAGADAYGVAAFSKRPRADSGQRRVIVSKVFDDIAERLGATRKELCTFGGQLGRVIAGHWKNNPGSWDIVRRASTRYVVDWLEARGWDHTANRGLIDRLIARPTVERQKRYSIVGKMKNDAQLFSDKITPRIRRTTVNLAPMQWVSTDNLIQDIFYTRHDGTIGSAKSFSWLDFGTGRMRLDVFDLGAGQGLRRALAIESAIRTFCGPSWGVPANLYLDNGPEFGFKDQLSTLIQLAHAQEQTIGVHTALPHHPQSKVIESYHRRFHRLARTLPGYIGGNRLAKMTHQVGKAPRPYAGSFADLERDLQSLIAHFNASKIGGHLHGRSPDTRFADAVASGWSAQVLIPLQVEIAFASPETRTVHAGGNFSFKGRVYHSPALLRYPTIEKASLRVPLGDSDTIFVMDPENPIELIGEATPAYLYEHGDLAGARDQGKQSRALRREIRQLDRVIPNVDTFGSLTGYTALFPAAPAAAAPTPVSALRRAALPSTPDKAASRAKKLRDIEIMESMASKKAG